MISSYFLKLSDVIPTVSNLLTDTYHLTSDDINNALTPYLVNLRDDLMAFIEYPYVEKVYRDSYYNFYSTKHYRHERDCARISFFESHISENDFRNKRMSKKLEDSFLGFIVIRPTITKLIGRSNISPKALKTHDFESCLCDIKSSINGIKLSSVGFPHSSQDTETLTCAETSIWGIMEYFGNKYAEYKPVLPSKIHSILSSISYERQIPSHGLTLSQISYALREFDLGTKMYSNSDSNELQRYLDYYIESGIPVIAALESSNYGHAVLVIGREKKDLVNLPSDYKPSKIRLLNGKYVDIIDSADIKKRYVAMDDNFPPYQRFYFEKPGEYYSVPPFINYKLTGLVVPLYSKVYSDAERAKRLTFEILKKFDLDFDYNEVILRLFLISSRSFKNEVAYSQDISDDIKEIIINTTMPKFIWVSEFSTRDQFTSDSAFGMILLNSTDNSIYTAINSIIFPEKSIVVNNGELLIYNNKLSTFNTLKNNLRGDWSSWQN